MALTTFFTWNKNGYTYFPIYATDNMSREVNNILNDKVTLSSVVLNPTTLFITNTNMTENDMQTTAETYQFTTTDGVNTLGVVTFTCSYTQPEGSTVITILPYLSTSAISATGIYSAYNGSTATISFDNVTGVRTLAILM